MKAPIRSHFAASVMGGVVVAGIFLALGVTGHRSTQTIIQESPVTAQPTSNAGANLTPHDIYERDAPGVVFVRAQIIEQVQDPFDLFPQQERSVSTGSGFLIDTAGDIVTNYHVVEGANRSDGVTVQFEDNVTRTAAVVGQDPNNDLALLKVSMAGVPEVRPLELGDSTTVRVGDPTLAIGNPFGLDRTLTSAIVSALQRQIQAPSGFSIDNVIQTDAPINPGNSGGPLLDATGRVIGINSQIETGGGAGQGSVGIAFAVPVNTAKEFMPRIKHGGHVEIADLGADGDAAPGPQPGVIVRTVQRGGPAATAGIAVGDRILAVAGRTVGSIGDVQQIVEAHLPGQSIEIRIQHASRVQHGSRVQTLSVKLGSRIESAPA
jgi:S1-C subfamily serine protease